jgi:hypothetical protein
MAYIGVQPTDTYLSIASQQITGNGGATYTLDYSVSDEESVAVFVNNVRQNVSSYTVSGDQLTLGGTISASDECWILFLGRTVGTKTPAVGSVTNDMLAGSIANAKLANSSITLNGSAVSLGGSASAGITEADQWRLNTTFTTSAGDNFLTANWERSDTYLAGYFGTGMTESSGVFTFPSTGYWYIFFAMGFAQDSGANLAYANSNLEISTDSGSNYNRTSRAFGNNGTNSGGDENNFVSNSVILDVTNISTTRLRLTSNAQGVTRIVGNSSYNATQITFLKLGDT